MNNDEQLRYPTGRFKALEEYTIDELRTCIDRIQALPEMIANEAAGLSKEELDTHYREGGWTIRQVLHHISDSHLNAYIRLKWTLTEDTPEIKPYNEKAWAETPETELDPGISIGLLRSLHGKWVSILRSLKAEDFKKSFIHPETGKHVTLARQVALYAWHGEHHLGHIRLVSQKR